MGTAPGPDSCEEEEKRLHRNADDNAEKLYASAALLYNQTWGCDVRASNTQLLSTHVRLKKGFLKLAPINSGVYGTTDAISKSSQLALLRVDNSLNLAEADATVELRRIVPTLLQIFRALDSLVIAGQDPVLPKQTAVTEFGRVALNGAIIQIQMDMTACQLAKSAFLSMANHLTASQLQDCWTNTFVRLLDMKMKSRHSASSGIQELMYHSAALGPSAVLMPTANSSQPAAGSPSEKEKGKRKVEDGPSDVESLRKDLKAAVAARDHNGRTIEEMRKARDARVARGGKGGGRGGRGDYNQGYGWQQPYYNQPPPGYGPGPGHNNGGGKGSGP